MVGAPGYYGSANPGAVYVFVRTGGAWTEQGKLLPSDGMAGDGFGDALALQGDTAVVGAPENSSAASGAGAVYVFARTGGIWTQEAKLLASNAEAGDSFGTSVALDADN